MNCKIGILTFHKSINYGSVLQAYALQNLLLKEGYKVEIIDYEPKNYANMYIPFKKPTTIWNILHNLNRVPVGKIIKEQNEKFKKFRDTYINLSREYNFESNYSDIFHNLIVSYPPVVKMGTDGLKITKTSFRNTLK